MILDDLKLGSKEDNKFTIHLLPDVASAILDQSLITALPSFHVHQRLTIIRLVYRRQHRLASSTDSPIICLTSKRWVRRIFLSTESLCYQQSEGSNITVSAIVMSFDGIDTSYDEPARWNFLIFFKSNFSAWLWLMRPQPPLIIWPDKVRSWQNYLFVVFAHVLPGLIGF